MSAFVVMLLYFVVIQYKVKRLAGKTVSETTNFLLGGTWNCSSVLCMSSDEDDSESSAGEESKDNAVSLFSSQYIDNCWTFIVA